MSYNSWTLPNRSTSSLSQGTTASSDDQQLFYSLSPVNGLLDGSQVRTIFQQSGLPSPQLAGIWDSVDRDKDGRINCQEFIQAMNMIRTAKAGVGGAYNSATMSLKGRPYSSTTSLATPPTSSLITGGVGRGVSLTSLNQTSWSITSDAKRRYNLMFNTHDVSRTGYISGEEARKVLTKSNLDQITLSKIWELSDYDKDGRLSTDEFAVAMYLIERAQKGLTPPTSLPPELLPQSKNTPPTSPIFSSFEDRKKANFDLGRNELERRRKMLLEEENRAKEERERKRQEEEDRKRAEMLKIEQQRQAELERQRQLAAEMDRARERALQQAALQREAELREIERKRKDEWTKRRQAELEQELKREKNSLQTIKLTHQQIMNQLTQIELNKRTLSVSLTQQKERCTVLNQSIEQLKDTYRNENGLLIQRAAHVKNLQQELSQLTPQHDTIRSRLSSLSHTSSSPPTSTLLLQEQYRAINEGLTNLKLSYTQHCTQLENSKSLLHEKKIKLTAVQNDCKLSYQTLQQLQTQKHNVLVAIETRHKQMEEEKRRQEQESLRRKQSLERVQQQQLALEEHIKKQQQQQHDNNNNDETKRQEEEEMKRKQEQEMKEYQNKMKTLEDAKRKADEALKRQKEILAKPNPFSFFKSKAKASEDDSKAKDAAIKKKVVELQQRKKELQKQKKRPSSGVIDDLKGLDLTSTQPNTNTVTAASTVSVADDNTAPLATILPVMTTPSIATPPLPNTTVVYESLDEIQEQAARQRTNSTTHNNSPLHTTATSTSNIPAAAAKPNLPPKPVNLRHSNVMTSSKPPLPPKPHPPVAESHLPPNRPPKPTSADTIPTNTDTTAAASTAANTAADDEVYIYEIPGNDNVSTQSTNNEPVVIQPLPPPPIAPKPRPPSAAPKPSLINKPHLPSETNIQQPLSPLLSQEVIYDIPPDSIIPTPKPRLSPKLTHTDTSNIQQEVNISHIQPKVEEVIYDMPPLQTQEDIAFYGNIDTTPSYGNIETTPTYVTTERSPSPDASSDAFYGNVPNPNYIEQDNSTVPTSPLPSILYRARYSFSATNDEEVSFIQGSIVTGCNSDSSNAHNGWLRVNHNEREGWAPLSYLVPINNDTTSSSLPNSPEHNTNSSSSAATATAATDIVEVMYSWEGSQPNHLSINKGDMITVKERGEGWWMGQKDGKVGWFPGKYVSPVTTPTPVIDETPPTATNDQYKAHYTFEGEHEGDLPFAEGDIINVLKKEGEWWLGETNGRRGLFPSTYVSPLITDNTLQVPNNKEGSAAGSRKLVGRVIVGYIALEENQLGLVPGQLVVVRRQEPNGWWEGQLHSRGQEKRSGWFPSNRIELLTPGTVTSPQMKTPSPSNNPTTGSLVLALYTYQATSPDELSFHKGSVLSVISKDDEEEWWKGELNGTVGLFPSNYVQSLDTMKSSDASQWSEMLTPEILAQIPSQQRKRQEAIFELIQTEKAYVHSLNLVKEVFFIPMENSGVLSQAERQQVIVNWEELITCNSAFCNALFIRLRTSGTIIRSIGDVLIEHIPHLTPHIRWCSCQLTACTLLQSKSHDPAFREYEQNCLKDTRTGGLPLSSFLLKPMQRVTKYPLLIGKILEYTPPEDLDYEPLLLALQESEKLCQQVNDGVREKENTESLEWLQSHVHLTLTEKLVFNSQTNFMGSRKLLFWGKFTKTRGNKEMVGFLFNDFLLLVRPKALFVTAAQLEPFTDNQFTMYREPFMLDQIQAKKAPVEQYGPSVFNIMLKSEKKEIPLKAESDSQRDKWLKHIMDACVAFVRQQKKTTKLQRSDSHRMTLRKTACGKLLVTVVSAADLIASSADGKSDPFCVIKVGENQEAATPVVKNDLNPTWNYTMPEFLITDPTNTVLEITVFDSDLFSPNDFLGCAKLSLSSLQNELGGNGPWNKKLLLEDVPKGELELRISYVLKRN